MIASTSGKRYITAYRWPFSSPDGRRPDLPMFRTIDDFIYVWSQEIEATQKILKHLTDPSLTREFSPGVRTLGRLAWHLVTTLPEMMARTGLELAGPKHDDPIPASAREIFRAYNESAISLLDQVKAKWTDATLAQEDDMYGERWKRSATLGALVFHQIHHRAQMTVVMRLAGLEVPGLYGPARQDWRKMGMEPPKV
jgi:uncharacterized damage-inducible protein DinB